MSIPIFQRPTVDTRGLPEGYDPLMFYEYRMDLRKANAVGLESFLYKLMPPSLIKSVAMTIDPFSQLKTSPGKITPWNRTKYRSTASILDRRRQHYYRYNLSGSSIVNYLNIPGNIGPFVMRPLVVLADQMYEYPRQEILPHVLRDSTRRTRLLGSDQGEMERYSATLRSPPRETATGQTENGIFTLNTPPGGFDTRTQSTEIERRTMVGYSAVLSKARYDSIMSSERTKAQALMQKHAISMFLATNPQSRNYSLTRNIIELRDLPRSVLQLQATVKNLLRIENSIKIPSRLVDKVRTLKTNLKDIPKEYLSYHFGWKLVVKDAYDLLSAPSKISKQINYLLKRNGQATTYRTSRKFLTGDSGVSGFEYVYMGGEYDLVTSSRIQRETELRMVLNSTFRFPDVNIPEFNGHLFADKLGIYPRLIDVYNLTPWTWLIDWYTGLGNYLELVENVSRDTSLINWGMLTAVTRGQLVTDYHSKSDIVHTEHYNEPYPWSPGIKTKNTKWNRHTSVMDFTFQLRKDVSSILDVNVTSDPSSLTDYQRSILGALITQRLDFRRR